MHDRDHDDDDDDDDDTAIVDAEMEILRAKQLDSCLQSDGSHRLEHMKKKKKKKKIIS
jgi:hypothetical protein